VQYWTGTDWQAIPGRRGDQQQPDLAPVGVCSDHDDTNSLNVTGALNGYARVIELEAWGIAAPVVPPPNTPPTGVDHRACGRHELY
jgi:hypothetical protein